MFVEEALWLKGQLAHLDLRPGDRVLDVGSSTRYFRQITQPYIDAEVFKPLRDRGVVPVHLDAKQADGVDIVCDATGLAALDGEFAAVVCSNLLEHVTNPGQVAVGAYKLVAVNSYLFLTAPRRYRVHADPVDTCYRPHWRDLFALVSWLGAERIMGATVIIGDRSKYNRRELWRRALRPWQASCLVVRKPAADERGEF
jgi:hypothetical protein